ncbi:ethylbenzene dehydrogenase [Geothermobacter ehrlichii]|uniref:Ethylbenzene dehydrogenase n=1 Tax=Geothermobacter ehrlichii TaxID=213224 RepID=A0A5D3WMU2_9BACT|nr:ethylbenzene dehydrogenase-related protein [Geothermobacter ehrlichii]TYO98685.1 ethylbenzene dehydrogenase [Geothermobacter ehrlichii]
MFRQALLLLTGSLLLCSQTALAAQTVTAVTVDTAPVVDGRADDPAWRAAPEIKIHDQVADTDIRLKSVTCGDMIYFLVRFADDQPNELHKPWVWDSDLEAYMLGPQREDSFVFKWNLEDHPVDLSNFSDDNYRADVWYWKANRTNPAGYADDKHHVLSVKAAPKAKAITSKSGTQKFLQRLGDEGTSTTKKRILTRYEGDIQPQYQIRQPNGSRADVRAKGIWADGTWTIEFARKLQTGHADDVQFDKGGKYLFGVSIYGLYGKPVDKSKPHLYGQGRISEPLTLVFK